MEFHLNTPPLKSQVILFHFYDIIIKYAFLERKETMASYASQKYEEIVTCDGDLTHILRKPVPFLTEKEWGLATTTVQKLMYVRNEILKGGAGLAAPQIGISLPIFIYTPDRTTENLRTVINPSFEPLGERMVEGYEACFSAPLRCAKLNRWEKINVHYQDLEGHGVEDVLEGFAAKVFQHEMDHLNGKLNIDHESAEVQTFTDAKIFEAYMKKIHQEDSKTYQNAAKK